VLVTKGKAFIFSTGIAGSRGSLQFLKQQGFLSVSQETGFSFLLQGSDAFPQVVGGITNRLSSGFFPIKIGILLWLGLGQYFSNSYSCKFLAASESTFRSESCYKYKIVLGGGVGGRQILIFFYLLNRNVINENCNIEKSCNYHLFEISHCLSIYSDLN
jgi:hypothetical protein